MRELPCVDIPLAVHAALGGRSGDELPVATAAASIYLGADLLDNLADRELPPEWEGCEFDALVLAGATLVSVLPTLALTELGEVAPRVSLALAESVATMADGQLRDLERTAETGAALASVTAKSGASLGGFAAAAALVGCARAGCVDASRRYGTAVGVAGQLGSDCHDVWQRRPSHDLANGTRTLPIAYGLACAGGAERARLEELLAQAVADPAVHDEVAALLAGLGALRYVALRVEVAVEQGRRALEDLAAHGHDVAPLRSRVDDLSMLRALRD